MTLAMTKRRRPSDLMVSADREGEEGDPKERMSAHGLGEAVLRHGGGSCGKIAVRLEVTDRNQEGMDFVFMYN